MNTPDRLLKELFFDGASSTLEYLIGLPPIASTEAFPGKFQHTIEREPDYVRTVTYENGTKEVLHLEFQLKSERDMIFRMRDYHSLIRSKVPDLYVRQYVIYLGKGKSKMRSSLRVEEVFTGFNLLNISDFASNELSLDDVPEAIVLSMMAGSGDEPPEAFARSIFNKLLKAEKDPTKLRRYLQNLLMAANMRNLGSIVQKLIDDMALDFNVRETHLYKTILTEGLEKGIEQGMEQGIEQGGIRKLNLLIIKNLQKGKPVEFIAEVFDVSVEYVEQVRKEARL